MPLEPNALDQVRARLSGMERVERVVFDEPARTVALICAFGAGREVLEQQAREALDSVGLPGAEWTIEVAIPVEERERRVRFIGVTREQRRDLHIEAQVTLELGGRQVTARTVSEQGEALELRAIATGALDALRELVEAELDVRVGGVKRTRSFDADLMVASLYRPGPPPQQFVGAVLVGGDPYRAAAVAVLSALNRHLGNYLLRS